MAVMEILVQITELVSATQEMNNAAETYQTAVELANKTAADLASKWEGAAREAFVRHQDNAYHFYKKMLEIIRDMINVVRQAIDTYQTMMNTVQGIVGG